MWPDLVDDFKRTLCRLDPRGARVDSGTQGDLNNRARAGVNPLSMGPKVYTVRRGRLKEEECKITNTQLGIGSWKVFLLREKP